LRTKGLARSPSACIVDSFWSLVFLFIFYLAEIPGSWLDPVPKSFTLVGELNSAHQGLKGKTERDECRQNSLRFKVRKQPNSTEFKYTGSHRALCTLCHYLSFWRHGQQVLVLGTGDEETMNTKCVHSTSLPFPKSEPQCAPIWWFS
jgi:hypothetical protein